MPQEKQAQWLQRGRKRRAFVTMDVAIVIALAVFMVDILTNLQGAIAVLYIAVPLLLATAYAERVVAAAGVICGILTTIAFVSQHLGESIDSAHTRFGVSIAALAVTTFLALRQKRIAAEREDARAKLEQASADLAHAGRVSMIGQLTASIAHEVNQPLTAIVAYGKSGKRWLDREEPDLAETAQCLDKIVANGTRAGDVIARIRSLVRKAPTELEAVDLAALIDETVALVSDEAKATEVSIRREVDPGIPRVWADRVQIQQVLANLLLNAIQAMQSVDGRERRLVVKLTHADDGLVGVDVCDSGTGIENISDLFAPFFTTKSDGLGMGLSISRSIVESVGGSIAARNNPDYGATFSFLLPTKASANPDLT